MKSLTVKLDMSLAIAVVCGLTVIVLYFVLRPVPILIEGQVISTKEEDYKLVHKPQIGAKIYFFTDKQAEVLQGLFDSWRRDTLYDLKIEYGNIFKTFGVKDGEKTFIPAELTEPIERVNRLEQVIKHWEENPKRIFPYSLNRDYLGYFFASDFLDQALWAVTDSNGNFSITLTKDGRYWAYCDEGATTTYNIFAEPTSSQARGINSRTGVWFFRFCASPGKLVLSSSNRVW